MKIKSVTINRFRGYSQPTKIDFDKLCVIIGKNDIGKSTVLEALDIFFNENKGCVKLDKDDINKESQANGEDCIEIEVEFTDLPDTVVIDATNSTTLSDEFLLTEQGTLSIIKKYPKAGKEQVFIRAFHPTNAVCQDLLQKKISELRKILEENAIDCDQRTKSSEIRKSIWESQENLEQREIEIEISKTEVKSIWEPLKNYMPLYTLFQSDRKNSESDEEVQDPMKSAVREIINDDEIQKKLSEVADQVKARLDDVASRTLSKLQELNPDIAKSLLPNIPESKDLKWIDVFKNVTIAGDDDIPVNKRGSGVKRLILISFFRAEAERRKEQTNLPNIIYAIEEPETAQHPNHQRVLAQALISLSQAPNTQVLLTSHSPEVVKQFDFENIVLIKSDNNKNQELVPIKKNELPYPSLNEVNFLAFSEATYEYHIELYGFIETIGEKDNYKSGKPTREYKRELNGRTITQQFTLTEYVRHQIHHPENKLNPLFTDEEILESINLMRNFIQGLQAAQNIQQAVN